MNKADIAKWYDQTSHLYNWFWYINSESFALHYGLWDKNTKNLHDALINTNKFMANKTKVSANTKVLDAGCGVGGSTIWLAKKLNAKVTGITISPKQLVKAKELAQKKGVQQLVKFELMDYLKTKFKDETFDVVWAIESVCHAENKIDFLNEAYRILKKGGRLIIADGVLMRNPKNYEEKKIYNDFNKGMLTPNLVNLYKFGDLIKKVGFKKVEALDETSRVVKSSKRIYISAIVVYPILKILRFFRLIPEIFIISCIAGLVQYEGVKRGLFGYGIFYGVK